VPIRASFTVTAGRLEREGILRGGQIPVSVSGRWSPPVRAGLR